MTLDVIFSPEAEDQLLYLADWWATNRPDSSVVIEDELARVLDLLVDQPGVGKYYERKASYPIHYHPLRGTPYYVFYSVVAEKNELHVLCVWSMVRGEGPPLKLKRRG